MNPTDYWFADPGNAKSLSDILHSPAFVQAVGLVIAGLPTEVPAGPSAVTDMALQGAYERGIRDFPKKLQELLRPPRSNERPPTKKPWSHKVVERSAFGETPPTPAKPSPQPAKP